MLCSGVLPKPMPGSSTILSGEMPAFAAISSERAKKAAISFMMSMAASTLVAVVHDDDGRMARRQQPGHVGIALQAPDVVGDGGAGIERPGDDGRFHAVDRDGDTERHDFGQDRLQPLQFFVGRDRLRAIGPGGFRADVDDVGAFGDHAPGLRQRALRRDELSAVGK